MAAPPSVTRVRLAELIAMISLGTDLGFGQPMEHVMRQSLIACGSPSGSASTRTRVRSSTTSA
jgi:hypothetical protein